MKHSPQQGFTLIEIAIAVAIVAVLMAFSVFSFVGLEEDRDARVVQAAQSSLQAVVSQASARLDINAKELRPEDVVNAVKTDLPGEALLTAEVHESPYVLTLPKSGRSARFEVRSTGEVVLTEVSSSFTRYHVTPTGVIGRI